MPEPAKENSDSPVFETVRDKLQPFNERGVTIADGTDITADLTIDSVAVLDLVMELEDEFGVSLPMNELSEIRTVGDLVRAVQAQTGDS